MLRLLIALSSPVWATVNHPLHGSECCLVVSRVDSGYLMRCGGSAPIEVYEVIWQDVSERCE